MFFSRQSRLGLGKIGLLSRNEQTRYCLDLYIITSAFYHAYMSHYCICMYICGICVRLSYNTICLCESRRGAAAATRQSKRHKVNGITWLTRDDLPCVWRVAAVAFHIHDLPYQTHVRLAACENSPFSAALVAALDPLVIATPCKRRQRR